MHPHRSRRAWAGLALAALVPLALAAIGSSEALADVVHLKGGRQLVGRVVEDGDPVKIELEGGVMALPRWRVERIERAELPEETYAKRRAALEEGDAAGALALAETARTLRRAADEGELLELAARWSPGDESAAERLWEWQVLSRPIEADEAAGLRLCADFGEGARLHRSAHWRIAHDVSPGTARGCGLMLEATWRAYHRFVVRLGLRPRPIEGRLEAFLFADHADWARATGLPPEAIRGLNGLFISRTGRILLFDAGTAPEAESAAARVGENVEAIATREAELDAKEAEIASTRAQLEAWRPSPADREGAATKKEQLALLDEYTEQVESERRRLRDAGEQLERYRNRLSSWWNSESVASALHEACHQVSFHLGLSRADQPLWLNEGLATLFESADPSAIVPEAVNRARLRDVRQAWADGRGGKLQRVLADAIVNSPDQATAYAEAWALTHFLVARRTREFARFLTAIPPPGKTPTERWQAAFRANFGEDLDALEKEWRVYVRDL